MTGTNSKFKICCIDLHEIDLALFNTITIEKDTCNVPRMSKIFKLRKIAYSDDGIGMQCRTVGTLKLFKLLISSDQIYLVRFNTLLHDSVTFHVQ